MPRVTRRALVLYAMVVLAVHAATAQQPGARSAPPTPAAGKARAATHAALSSGSAASSTTLAGVYTAEQASRGKDVYLGFCKSCHAPSSGAMFKQDWVGKPLANLYAFVSERMPKNDPGTLAPGDAADVVAYLLQVNAMPTGTAELPADPDSLKKIRVQLAKTGSAKKR